MSRDRPADSLQAVIFNLVRNRQPAVQAAQRQQAERAVREDVATRQILQRLSPTLTRNRILVHRTAERLDVSADIIREALRARSSVRPWSLTCAGPTCAPTVRNRRSTGVRTARQTASRKKTQ
jgi:hypothetical protein